MKLKKVGVSVLALGLITSNLIIADATVINNREEERFIESNKGLEYFSSGVSFRNNSNGVLEQKLAGRDRYKTAVEVSKDGWDKSDKVILVNGVAISDALTVAPLAEEYNAPILLTEKDNVNVDTLNEIKRLGASNITVVGGEGVVSKQQENTLKKQGYTVERLGGKDRIDTSLKIATKLNEVYKAKGEYRTKTMFIANGYKGLVDATSVSSPASSKDAYILYTNGTDVSPIKGFINTKVDKVYLIGGDSVISKSVENNLKNTTNKSIERIAGIDRKETNAKVLEEFYPNGGDKIYVAKDGMGAENQLVDALAVGSLAGKESNPIILASDNLSNGQINYLNGKDIINKVVQVGDGRNTNPTKQAIDILNGTFKPNTQKPNTQKPETQKPSGMDFNTYASKLSGMGFDDETGSYFDENGLQLGTAIADSKGAYFILFQHSPKFDSVIKNCFNMLLPTKGNELFNIISSPCGNKTLEMDGRKVVIKEYPQGFAIDIYNK